MAQSNRPRQLSVEDRQLIAGYLASLEAHPHNTPRLFAIGFVGPPGSGKSTVANWLAARLKLPLNRSDQIRRYLNSMGIPGPSPRQDIMAALSEARNAWFYQHHTSAIFDANFREYAAQSQENAQAYGAQLLLVHTTCPDKVALERLHQRNLGAEAHSSSAGTEDYARVQAASQNFPPVDTFFTFDTTQSIELQGEALCSRLARSGYIAGT